MGPFVDPAFDNRTLLQIASADLSIDRAQESWRIIRNRFLTSREIIDWVNGDPCERLLPLLGARAEILDIDEQLRERCQEETDIAWGLNTRLFQALRPVLGKWQELGITPIAVKGLALFGDVYPDHRLRHVGDADVMVKTDQVRPTVRILHELGWRVPQRAATCFRLGEHSMYFRHPSGPGLDLHTRPAASLTNSFPSPSGTYESLPVAHPLINSGLIRLDPASHAVVLAIHIQQPGNSHLAHSMVDLYRLFTRLLESGDQVLASALYAQALHSNARLRLLGVISRLEQIFDPSPLEGFRQIFQPSQTSTRERVVLASEHEIEAIRSSATNKGLDLGQLLRVYWLQSKVATISSRRFVLIPFFFRLLVAKLAKRSKKKNR